jgi:tetratricopeptide (TPR) repeat protein
MVRVLVLLLLVGAASAQNRAPRSDDPRPPQQPTSDGELRPGAEVPVPPVPANESSSRESIIDLTPPPRTRPPFAQPEETVSEDGEVREFRPYDPKRALKNLEVGEYYFKQKNFRAALSRFQEALEFKPNDAMARLWLGRTYEKMNQPDEAIASYQGYLKILPSGPAAPEAKQAINRLNQKKESSAK